MQVAAFEQIAQQIRMPHELTGHEVTEHQHLFQRRIRGAQNGRHHAITAEGLTHGPPPRPGIELQFGRQFHSGGSQKEMIDR